VIAKQQPVAIPRVRVIRLAGNRLFEMIPSLRVVAAFRQQVRQILVRRSHDGTRIAFASDRGSPLGSSYNIWVLDVAIVEGNPIENIENANKVKRVIANGRVFKLEDLLEGKTVSYTTTGSR
jgi:hypothetical protein